MYVTNDAVHQFCIRLALVFAITLVRPRLLLETWLIYETWLPLEKLRYYRREIRYYRTFRHTQSYGPERCGDVISSYEFKF